jgi:hypothetical protein
VNKKLSQASLGMRQIFEKHQMPHHMQNEQYNHGNILAKAAKADNKMENICLLLMTSAIVKALKILQWVICS